MLVDVSVVVFSFCLYYGQSEVYLFITNFVTNNEFVTNFVLKCIFFCFEQRDFYLDLH